MYTDKIIIKMRIQLNLQTEVWIPHLLQKPPKKIQKLITQKVRIFKKQRIKQIQIKIITKIMLKNLKSSIISIMTIFNCLHNYYIIIRVHNRFKREFQPFLAKIVKVRIKAKRMSPKLKLKNHNFPIIREVFLKSSKILQLGNSSKTI